MQTIFISHHFNNVVKNNRIFSNLVLVPPYRNGMEEGGKRNSLAEKGHQHFKKTGGILKDEKA